MALDSFAGLKASIEEHIDRDDITIDDLIVLAESRHKDEVRIRQMLTRGALALNDGSRTVAFPSDFAAMKHIRLLNPITGATRRYLPPLRQLSEDELTDLSTNEEGPPKFFAILEQIEFDSEADQNYTGDILYYAELTALSDSNTTNALLDRAPDVYLYGALAASAPLLMNDERIPVWETLYQTGRNRINKADQTNRTSGPQIARVKGV